MMMIFMIFMIYEPADERVGAGAAGTRYEASCSRKCY